MASPSPAGRDRLSQALMELGRLSSDHIKKAEALQTIHGGGLDTALLEMGVLEEAAVLEALARARGASAVDPLDLRAIPPEIVRLMPAKAAQRLRAVPFRAAAASAHLAVLDASDLTTQDELAFVVGRRVRLFVTTEIRLIEALGKYYGAVVPPRFRSLLERLPAPSAPTEVPATPEEFETLSGEAPPFAPRPGEAMGRRRQVAGGDVSTGVPAASTAPAAMAVDAPAAADSGASPDVAAPASAAPSPPRPNWVVPLSEAERARLRPALPAAPPPPAATVNPLASERDAIADRLLRDVLPAVDRVLLLRVRNGKVEGWRGAGAGVDLARLAQFAAPIVVDSAFFRLAEGGRFHLGPLAPSADQQRLAAIWGGGTSAGSAVLPLKLSGRLGALLYLDRISRPIAPPEIDRWEALCEHAARDLEGCVRRGKHRQS